ncbi:MAG: hypothetical protein ACWGIK_18200 [Achromobacter pulmonis]|uniref:Surface antigen domain-containing protein n=1 Tax=Achromobacter pulmonis TaxID=1389932 RepID=A0A6S7ED07_9BURK|nr:hypothetical protein [Achromobacter pulmonis]MCF7768630.1 hypothetical protein [Achromobacter pulmonis]MPT28235.1 hypothetical protein [Achromobacter sp.]CAB3648380.1 hypothetical protein LMG26696_02673 [Achromobacter pulmonis]CAB3907004.1 hypothetical protein LMG26788_04586 [Achromobacter pulmonis]
MKTIRLIAFALAAGAASGPVLAAPAVMLNNALITQISKADKPAFHQAVAEALNNTADGRSVNWSSTPKRKAAPITAKITPLQTSTAGDRTCRLLEGDFARTSTTETWKFWFCKQSDGTWKASAN